MCLTTFMQPKAITRVASFEKLQGLRTSELNCFTASMVAIPEILSTQEINEHGSTLSSDPTFIIDHNFLNKITT